MQDLDLSPDGWMFATSGQWVNRLWDTESGVLQCEMRGHEDACLQITFSPDGRELATASADASVRLWKVRDGSVKRIIGRRPPNTPVTSLAFSADGKHEALGSADGVVRVWNAHDGGFEYELRGHEGAVHALSFSAESAWLFSGSADRTMRVWDMAHGTISALHPSFDREDALGALAVGGSQKLIASTGGPLANAGIDPTIKLWTSHFDRPKRVLAGHTRSVRSVALAPGVDLLASAGADDTLKLWDPRTGECLRTQPSPVLINIIAFALARAGWRRAWPMARCACSTRGRWRRFVPGPRIGARCSRWRSARMGVGTPRPAEMGRWRCGIRDRP